MNKYNLKIGQTLYLRPERALRTGSGSSFEEHLIEKIGRVYARLNHPYYRVNLETLALDGGRGSVWLSEKHFNDAQELSDAWRQFIRAINDLSYRRPDYVTLEAIKEARLKLGI